MGINFLLLKNSFKTGWKRMALIAGSVAIGVLILFSFTAVFNAVTDMDHVAWMNNLSSHGSAGHQPIDGVDPVYVAMMGTDELAGRSVQIVDMQRGGDNTPNIADSLSAPNPGEFYASPALADYIAGHSDEHLEYRYGKCCYGRSKYYICIIDYGTRRDLHQKNTGQAFITPRTRAEKSFFTLSPVSRTSS